MKHVIQAGSVFGAYNTTPQKTMLFKKKVDPQNTMLLRKKEGQTILLKTSNLF